MKKIYIKLGVASYDVLIANALLREAGALITARSGRFSSLCVVVTTSRVERFWGKELYKSLRKARLDFKVLRIPDGEPHKNLRTIEALMKGMIAAGADRKSVVIAFGGGVVGDVAGFAASIFMRGIPCIQIPTTLLAQVDASIGGKTGVNLSGGKNLVGTFHQPGLVVIDPKLLSTVPEREYRSGLFEVIKCGVIQDAKLFRLLEANLSRVKGRDLQFLSTVIQSAVKVKANIVSKDEKEGGLRRVLNFGHTIGHALEADGNYKKLLHGEAVGWGMIAATHIGVEMGMTPEEDASRITRLILRSGPLPKVDSSAANVLRLIKSDKKTVHGVPHFVVPTAIGKTIITDKVRPAAIIQAISNLKKLAGVLE